MCNDFLEAFGLDPNVIAILKGKYGELLLPIQERASFLEFLDNADPGNL